MLPYGTAENPGENPGKTLEMNVVVRMLFLVKFYRWAITNCKKTCAWTGSSTTFDFYQTFSTCICKQSELKSF